jgi:ribosomal protein L12E/L44/L45/RPP1/RPP2
MKYLASYLLLQLGGNASPSASDISALLETVGVEAESEQLDKLIAELNGKDINEVSEANWATQGVLERWCGVWDVGWGWRGLVLA